MLFKVSKIRAFAGLRTQALLGLPNWDDLSKTLRGIPPTFSFL